jgi:hypothetical protein
MCTSLMVRVTHHDARMLWVRSVLRSPLPMVRVTHHYTRVLWVPSLLLCTSSVTYAMFAGAITRPMHVILTQGDCAV